MSQAETNPQSTEAVALYKQAAQQKLALQHHLLQEKAKLARQYLHLFWETVIRDSQTSSPIVCAATHLSWSNHIHTYMPTKYDIGILACWSGGKSTLISIGLPLFLLGLNRNARIGIISNTDNTASKRLTTIGEYIRYSKEYRAVFPHVVPAGKKAWNNHQLYVERDIIAPEGSIESFGIDVGGIGSRFDFLIYDDPIDDKDAESEAVRMKRIEKINNVWSSRVEPTGKMFWIATRWHQYDATHEQLQKPNWKFLVQGVTEDFDHIAEPPPEYSLYPAVINRENPKLLPLWEARWPKERLIDKCNEIGIRAFNRGFRQRPYGSGDTLFSFDAVMNSVNWKLKPEHAIEEKWFRYLGCDLSSDRRPGTVITVVARNPLNGKKVLCEIQRGDWGFKRKTVDIIVDMFQRWNCILGYVENNSAQELILTMIRELYSFDLPIKGFTTGKNKADPMEGLPGLAVEFENGLWQFPFGDERVARHRNEIASSDVAEIVLLRELTEFPNGMTSDCMMALWFASCAAKSGQLHMVPGLYKGKGRGRIFGNGKYIFGSSHSKRIFG